LFTPFIIYTIIKWNIYRNKYIIAYDIADNKRLNKLHNYYGILIQYFIFICELSLTEREIMITDIYAIIKSSEDSVIIYNAGTNINKNPLTPRIKKKAHKRKAIIV